MQGPDKKLAAQRIRRRARVLAGALLLVAGLIRFVDPDFG